MSGFTKAYQEWSTRARIRQIELGVGNKQLAAELDYSRQYVTSVVNGKREVMMAIQKISKRLNMEKPNYD